MDSRALVIFREIMSEERVLVLRKPVIVYIADKGNRMVGRMTGFNIEVNGNSVEEVIRSIVEMVFFLWDEMMGKEIKEMSEVEKRFDRVMLNYIEDIRKREEIIEKEYN